jgi:hypothetical protein
MRLMNHPSIPGKGVLERKVIVNNPLIKRACLFMRSPIAERILFYLFKRENWRMSLTRISKHLKALATELAVRQLLMEILHKTFQLDFQIGAYAIIRSRLHAVPHGFQWRSEPRTFNSGSSVSIRNNVSGRMRQAISPSASFTTKMVLDRGRKLRQ